MTTLELYTLIAVAEQLVHLVQTTFWGHNFSSAALDQTIYEFLSSMYIWYCAVPDYSIVTPANYGPQNCCIRRFCHVHQSQ